MAPTSAIGSEDNDQDLKFLAEIKNEVPSEKISSQIPDSVYLGMRRNSSFADYFEGDLSQNLLSRRFFPTLSDSSSSSSDHQHQEVINRLVNKIQNDNNINSTPLNPSGDKKSKKLSEIITGHWFFTKNGKLDFGKGKGLRRKRTISLPCDGAEDDDDDSLEEGSGSLSIPEEDRGSLTSLVTRHFSASSDLRALNISSPQSQ